MFLLIFPLILLVVGMNESIQLGGIIDLNNLENYANQEIPSYITKDNTPIDNQITDAEATLGRVLFYDKKLSTNNSISCASCHQQAAAFSDIEDLSTGVNGITSRHSPRLINLRFGEETNMFWDEKASSLEELIFTPIQDHLEMGFSETSGQPGLDSLFTKLSDVDYYRELFNFAYGDATVNKERIEKSIAQFLRSIQSFDSKYDDGRSIIESDSLPFPNFNTSENFGKQVFMESPIFDEQGNRITGGAGCASCHRPPEFDIDPDSGNNGEIRVYGSPTETELNITRAPTLRNLADEQNVTYGGFFHNASMGGIPRIYAIFTHYNEIPNIENNPNIDERLTPNGHPQKLNLNVPELAGLAAFLKTLRGDDVISNKKWSDPFDETGGLEIVPVVTSNEEHMVGEQLLMFPNPVNTNLFVKTNIDYASIEVLDAKGQTVIFMNGLFEESIDVSHFDDGLYYLRLIVKGGKRSVVRKFVVVR